MPGATNIQREDTGLDQLIARLSLEEQVGQLLMVMVSGTELDQETLALLRAGHVNGVHLLKQGHLTPDQFRTLTEQVQALAGRPGLPALVSIDQEGGRVQRLQPPATSFPSAMAIGATGSADHARRWGLATARELRAVGINTDCAPVLDVNNNPHNPVIGARSFGERVELVTALGLAALAGLREGGVASCGKHFPGHGDTHIDTHFALPAIEHGLERLRVVELAPFTAAIGAGVPLIMTTHITFPAYCPDGLPATLSRAVLTDLLRGELGFDGVVISDAMDMKAIAENPGVVEGAVAFIAAGGDIVLGTRDDRAVYDALLAAVRSGRIPREQFAASVRRVARLKRWIARQPPADPAWFGAPEHQEWATAIALDALTLLRDDARLLPLHRDTRLAVIDCAYQWSFMFEVRKPETSGLAEALRARFPRVTGVVIDGQEPTAADRDAARAAVAAADVVLLGTRATGRFPAQAAFIDTVLSWGKPVAAVALSEPYDLLAYPATRTALATYGADPAMLDALGAVLAGEERARGRLPVSLPGLYEVGHGG